MTIISEIEYKEYKSLNIENNKLSLVTIPELGGKIISFKNKSTGFDFAFNHGPIELSKVKHDSDYSLSSTFGIDECFPTIAPCIYPEGPWKGEAVADHGEIWSTEFESIVRDSTIIQKASGKKYPYIFHRYISLYDDKAVFKYEVNNTGKDRFKYIWSFHPQFDLYKNTEIKVPGNAKFLVDYSKNDRFKLKTKEYSWPFAVEKEEGAENFSRINKLDGNAEKLYLVDLKERRLGLIYHDQKEEIYFSSMGNGINNFGLWINRGGWPFSGIPYNTIAIEPCNCITDRLDDAIRQNVYDSIEPGEKNNWEIMLEVK